MTKNRKTLLRKITEYFHRHWKQALCILAIFFLCFYISRFWYQIMLIQGDSMEPSYHSWQFVLLDKHTKQYDCGDVVAFQCDGLKAVLIKRVVAVPGDTVQIVDGVLYRNGAPTEEGLVNGSLDYAGIAEKTVTLGENEYFLLGDNYEESKDSRYEKVGCVLEEDILGKVIPQKAI